MGTGLDAFAGFTVAGGHATGMSWDLWALLFMFFLVFIFAHDFYDVYFHRRNIGGHLAAVFIVSAMHTVDFTVRHCCAPAHHKKKKKKRKKKKQKQAEAIEEKRREEKKRQIEADAAQAKAREQQHKDLSKILGATEKTLDNALKLLHVATTLVMESEALSEGIVNHSTTKAYSDLKALDNRFKRANKLLNTVIRNVPKAMDDLSAFLRSLPKNVVREVDVERLRQLYLKLNECVKTYRDLQQRFQETNNRVRDERLRLHAARKESAGVTAVEKASEYLSKHPKVRGVALRAIGFYFRLNPGTKHVIRHLKLDQDWHNYDYTGLIIFSHILRKLDFSSLLDECKRKAAEAGDVDALRKRCSKWSDEDFLRLMMLLIASGDLKYTSIDKLRPMAKELGFKRLPSERHLRRNLARIAALPELEERIMALNRDFLKVYCQKYIELYMDMANLNLDTTPFDNTGALKRERCTLTYMKDTWGYTPMMAYLGHYILAAQFREGSDNCQCEGTPDFFKDVVLMTRSILGEQVPVFVRADCGHDACDTMMELVRAGAYFTIARNIRTENVEVEFNRHKGQPGVTEVHEREGKTILVLSDYRAHPALWTEGKATEDKLRCVMLLIERTISSKGEVLPHPEYEAREYWTVTGMSDGTVVETYHAHAQIEQNHSEVKTDLNLERFPSESFEVNRLIFDLGVISFNILRLMGDMCLEDAVVESIAGPLARETGILHAAPENARRQLSNARNVAAKAARRLAEHEKKAKKATVKYEQASTSAAKHKAKLAKEGADRLVTASRRELGTARRRVEKLLTEIEEGKYNHKKQAEDKSLPYIRRDYNGHPVIDRMTDRFLISSVIENVIRVPGYRTVHANTTFLHLPGDTPWRHSIIRMFEEFTDLRIQYKSRDTAPELKELDAEWEDVVQKSHTEIFNELRKQRSAERAEAKRQQADLNARKGQEEHNRVWEEAKARLAQMSKHPDVTNPDTTKKGRGRRKKATPSVSDTAAAPGTGTPSEATTPVDSSSAAAPGTGAPSEATTPVDSSSAAAPGTGAPSEADTNTAAASEDGKGKKEKKKNTNPAKNPDYSAASKELKDAATAVTAMNDAAKAAKEAHEAGAVALSIKHANEALRRRNTAFKKLFSVRAHLVAGVANQLDLFEKMTPKQKLTHCVNAEALFKQYEDIYTSTESGASTLMGLMVEMQKGRLERSAKDAETDARRYVKQHPEPVPAHIASLPSQVDKIQEAKKQKARVNLIADSDFLYKYAGLPVVADILRDLNFGNLLPRQTRQAGKRGVAFTMADCLLIMCLLLAIADPHYTSVRKLYSMAAELGFPRGLPSDTTLRNALETAARDPDLCQKLVELNRDLLVAYGVKPKLVCGFAVLDIDTSPFNNTGALKREKCNRTYKKGVDGYTPILAYTANGFLLSMQFREGKAGCQCEGTPDYFCEQIDILQQLVFGRAPVLVRADCGHDSFDTMMEIVRKCSYFIISRNIHADDAQAIFENYLREHPDAVVEHVRAGEERIIFSDFRKHASLFTDGKDNGLELRCVTVVTRRTATKNGDYLAVPTYEARQYWSNIGHPDRKFTDKEIVELYHAHGTMEQFHSELKTGLNIERFPSQSYAVNALIANLAVLVYNILRLIGQECLKETVVAGIAEPVAKMIAARKAEAITDELNLRDLQDQIEDAQDDLYRKTKKHEAAVAARNALDAGASRSAKRNARRKVDTTGKAVSRAKARLEELNKAVDELETLKAIHKQTAGFDTTVTIPLSTVTHDGIPGTRRDYDGHPVVRVMPSRFLIQTIIENFICVPGYTTHSERTEYIHISENTPWRRPLVNCYIRFSHAKVDQRNIGTDAMWTDVVKESHATCEQSLQHQRELKARRGEKKLQLADENAREAIERDRNFEHVADSLGGFLTSLGVDLDALRQEARAKREAEREAAASTDNQNTTTSPDGQDASAVDQGTTIPSDGQAAAPAADLGSAAPSGNQGTTMSSDGQTAAPSNDLGSAAPSGNQGTTMPSDGQAAAPSNDLGSTAPSGNQGTTIPSTLDPLGDDAKATRSKATNRGRRTPKGQSGKMQQRQQARQQSSRAP